jgi:16S rRNA (adenine1518-N6/adenine1519-N6)-dimethyltransferase
VAAAGITPEDAVVEIGPGLGDLTRAIAAVARRVVAIEVDRGIHAALAASPPPGRIEVRLGDALAEDLSGLGRSLGEPVVLMGNVSYQIAGRLLMKILAEEGMAPYRRAAFMMQAEVAERLAAPPGSDAYGVLSVFTQRAARTRVALRFGPEAFVPRPRVQSAFVVVDPLPGIGAPPAELRALVAAAFQQRRKTLRSVLRRLAGSAALAEAALAAAGGLDGGRRGETLSGAELASLARALAPYLVLTPNSGAT